jgi:type I restriction enzyme M protein
MNLAVHGIEPDLGQQHADTFLRDLHPDLKADYILANPPFNVSDWSGQLLRGDKRWKFGDPPVGNANYAWIQHFIHHLAYPNGKGGGVAGFVMANGSLSSNTGGEGDIRRKIIEADLVDCIIALPAQLFYTTGIPVSLWFLTRDKSGKNLARAGGGRSRKGETLFIDARKLGTMQTRTLRVLSGAEKGETVNGEHGPADGNGDPLPGTDIGRIVYKYRQWRGEPAPKWWDAKQSSEWKYADAPGFCKATNQAEIEKHGCVLTPGRFVGAEEQEADAEPFAEKFPGMVAELEKLFTEAEQLASVIRSNLRGLSA